MRRIKVGLGERSYEVLIGRGLLERAGELIGEVAPGARAAVVTDETVEALHRPAMVLPQSAGDAVLEPGEQTKSFDRLAWVCDRLSDLGLGRRDLVVALGGGVIGDLAGFAAAVYMRGIGYVQAPTTLLAQVDSSVGGKTAIDTAWGKNLVGAFHQPRLVLADLDALETLPDRQMRSGLAEVLKYGLLGDAGFFEWLADNGGAVLDRDPAALEHAVARCVEMKAEIVADDEHETTGRRALLNLGHTYGHALEAETGFGETLSHGEAVAIGCAMAFRFSAARGLCPPEDARRAEEIIGSTGLPVRLDQAQGGPFKADALIARMAHDKKAEAGLTLVLARRIGEAFLAKGVEPVTLRRFLVSEGALS
jgi:3-dehydroquinate synthase